MNPNFYDQLKQTLAPERLDAYGSENDAPELILARYLLNMALCESLYSPLQMAEIALRNGIHRELSTHFKTAEWFRNQVSQTAWQLRKVKEAEEMLRAKAKPVTSGRIVAEMNFGYWTSYFNKAHAGSGLGHLLASKVFIHAPRRQRNMKTLDQRWKRIRDLRNRVFHHERILHWNDLDQQHAEILEAIHWISPELAELSKTLDRYTQTRQAGLKPWIDQLNR
tara:strand:- start:122 stop:790 length:669 start_codon:yes stop_codon:yes gene_type:complete